MSHLRIVLASFSCVVLLFTGCRQHAFISVNPPFTVSQYKSGDTLVFKTDTQHFGFSVYVAKGLCTEKGSPLSHPAGTEVLPLQPDGVFRCTLKPKPEDGDIFTYYIDSDPGPAFGKSPEKQSPLPPNIVQIVGPCKQPCPRVLNVPQPQGIHATLTQVYNHYPKITCESGRTAKSIAPDGFEVNNGETIFWTDSTSSAFTIAFTKDSICSGADQATPCTVVAPPGTTSPQNYTATVTNTVDGQSQKCIVQGSIQIVN